MMMKGKRLSLIILVCAFILMFSSVSAISLTSTSGGRSNIVSYENVQITLLNQNPDPAEPGEYVELRFNVVNNGAQVSKAKFEIMPEFPFTVVSESVYEIEEFKGSGKNSYTLYYKLKVSEDAVEGDNNIKLRFMLSNGNWVIAGPFSVRVKTHDAVLNVESIKTEPERISPGQEANLEIKLKNWADSLLKDVNVKLDLSSQDFSPIGTTNERTFSSIDAKESVVLNFKIVVDSNAEVRVHQIPIEISYYDEEGTEYSKNVTIGVYLEGEPEYFLNLESSEVYESGTKGRVVFSLSNIGSSDIKFLTLEFKESDDYEIVSNRKEYLGNLESDDFETSEYDIHINSVKNEIPLLVVLTYKDSYNNLYVKEESVPLKLYTKNEAVKLGLATSAGLLTTVISYWSIVLAIFLLGFWFYMIYDIIKNPLRSEKSQLFWLFIILLFNFVGGFLYFIFARKRK